MPLFGVDIPVNAIPDNVQGFLAFAMAFLVTTLATPRLRQTAIAIGLVDSPDGRLKTHREPVPYLGGVAVALGVLAALGAVYQFDHQVLATLLGGSIVLVLGLIDDLGSLGPAPKLAGQALAALTLVKAGVRLELTFLPTAIEVPLTILWVMAVTNAFNLVDIMDGLSSGIGVIAAVFLGGISYLEGHVSAAFLAAALAGALLAFRRFNAHPARIYLGDTGSLFCGFLLSAIAMVNSYTAVHVLGLVAPLLILSFPLFDMTFVVLVRAWRRIPVLRGSPDHVALRLRGRLGGTVATVRACLAWGVLFGASAVGIMRLPLEAAVALAAVDAVLFLVLGAWLLRIGRPSTTA